MEQAGWRTIESDGTFKKWGALITDVLQECRFTIADTPVFQNKLEM